MTDLAVAVNQALKPRWRYIGTDWFPMYNPQIGITQNHRYIFADQYGQTCSVPRDTLRTATHSDSNSSQENNDLKTAHPRHTNRRNGDTHKLGGAPQQ